MLTEHILVHAQSNTQKNIHLKCFCPPWSGKGVDIQGLDLLLGQSSVGRLGVHVVDLVDLVDLVVLVALIRGL